MKKCISFKIDASSLILLNPSTFVLISSNGSRENEKIFVLSYSYCRRDLELDIYFR